MIGKRILNYEIISLIGEGGMGQVYLARHSTLERKVAVKVLNPELASNEELRQRFINEAKVLSSITHQNIVSLFDLTQFEDNLVIIMEYVEGNSLEYVIKNIVGAFPEARAGKIFEQILNAFSFAHSRGIIHRDIKPSNILLQSDDVPKILDFGIAKIIQGDLSLTKTGTRLGTVFYMSPEQIMGNPLDARTDIYSLGVTLFEMLTGKKPYDESITSEYLIQEKIVKEPLPAVRSIYPAVSEKMEFIVAKATRKNPADRFMNCDEFKNEIIITAQSSITNESIYSQKTIAASVSGSTIPPPPPIAVNQVSDYTSAQFSSQGTGYPNPYISQNKKSSKAGLVLGGIFLVIIIIGIFVLGGLYIASLFNDDSEEITKTEKKKTEKIDKKKNKNDEIRKDDDDSRNIYGIEGIDGAKLYFCEDYQEKEINVSERFTTGWLTVMLDLRPANQKIGVSSVYLKLTQIKNKFGDSIKEKFIKKVKFTVEPDFDYIYFQDKKNLKFNDPGTYLVSLYTNYDELIAQNTIEIIEK